MPFGKILKSGHLGVHFQHSGAKIRVFERKTVSIKFWLFWELFPKKRRRRVYVKNVLIRVCNCNRAQYVVNKCIVSSPLYMENGSLGSSQIDTRAQGGKPQCLAHSVCAAVHGTFNLKKSIQFHYLVS